MGRWILCVACVAMLLPGAAAAAGPVHGLDAASVRGGLAPWTLGEIFTFLFVTLGPLNVIGPFTAMTQARAKSVGRRLAAKASLVALVALFVAATVGAATLQAWGISTAALLLAAGVILFLVALRPVLAGYSPAPARDSQAAPSALIGQQSEISFWPLAFPTIITPYGLALLILLFAVYPLGFGGLQILVIAASVLLLNYLVMLSADRIAKFRLVEPGLAILGCIMNVLLIALGVQVAADSLQLIANQGL